MPSANTITKPPPDLRETAQGKAAGRPYKLVKVSGRILLIIAAGADLFEIYEADFAAKTIVKKAGAWGVGTAASAGAAKVASPLLAFGPLGWVGYGIAVGGSGGLGYFLGGEATKTVYEVVFEYDAAVTPARSPPKDRAA